MSSAVRLAGSERLPEFDKAKQRVTYVPCTCSQGDTGPLSATPTPQGPLLQQLPMEMQALPSISEAACAAVAALAPHSAAQPPNAASFQTARPPSQAHLQLLTLPAPGVTSLGCPHQRAACSSRLSQCLDAASLPRNATLTSLSPFVIDTTLRRGEHDSENLLSPELRSCFNHAARHSLH